jgi:hypothetical protein
MEANLKTYRWDDFILIIIVGKKNKWAYLSHS